MNKDNRNLLLQDLSSRIPYGVKVSVNQSELQNYDYKWKNWSFDEEPQEIDGVSIYGVTFGCRDMSDGVIGFEYIKPYLFPLSSMTDELWNKEFMGCGITEFTRDSFKYGCETLEFNNDNPDLSSMVSFINQLIKNHFDIYGLIPMGLAIDATNLNIY